VSDRLPRDWIELQFDFVDRFVELNLGSLRDALNDLTNFQSRLRLGPAAEMPKDDRWVALVESIEKAPRELRASVVCEAASRNPDAAISHRSLSWPTVGAFSLEVDGTVARTHFASTDVDELSPLHPSKLSTRREELDAVVELVGREHPEVRRIRGGSWLYHLDSYRSLFPTAHLDTAVDRTNRSIFRGMSHWGQFLDHRGSLRIDRAEIFRHNLSQWDGTSDLCALFPLSTLVVESPIENFRG